MAKYFLYLKSDLDQQVQTYAKKLGISAKDAIKIIVDQEVSKHESDKSDRLSSLETKTNLLLVCLERLLPDVSYLAASTRSSLAGKGLNPGIDGEMEAQKSKRFFASILKEINITPTNE